MHLESADTDLNLSQPSREGLPAAFKMRRERHYVEQLMGDAPLRTVREIPVADIEPLEGDGADLEQLQQSIEDVGILQPLLVSKSGAPAARSARGGVESGAPAARSEGGGVEHQSRFTIIAGANRYRVAVQLGLRTVPCLVCETSAHTVDALREAAATRRAALPVSSEPSMPSMSDESRHRQPAAGLREVTARLAFVSAVMPALDVAGDDPLRWNILTDLMKVEMERARSTAAAVEWLSSSSTTAVREELDAATIVDAVLDAVSPEARLQGVKLEISSSLNGYRLPADRAMIVRALTGLVQAVLALSSAGSTVRIDCSGTAVRPALIIAVTQEDCDVTEAAAERFFDADFAQHPNGFSGALVLAGVAHAARLHGGRAHARAHEARGCTATLVIPKPLQD